MKNLFNLKIVRTFIRLIKLIKPIRLIKPYLQLLTFFKFASITSLSTISFLTIVDDEGNDDKLNDGDLTIPSNMLFLRVGKKSWSIVERLRDLKEVKTDGEVACKDLT